MSQSLTPGPDGARRGPRAGLRVGSLGFVAMIVILIVAIIFAANQNDVIGWLVVAVAAGWLVFAVVVYLQMRRGVQAAGRKVCLLYTSPSPRDRTRSRMPSSA